jgi:hypothetical protein
VDHGAQEVVLVEADVRPERKRPRISEFRFQVFEPDDSACRPGRAAEERVGELEASLGGFTSASSRMIRRLIAANTGDLPRVVRQDLIDLSEQVLWVVTVEFGEVAKYRDAVFGALRVAVGPVDDAPPCHHEQFGFGDHGSHGGAEPPQLSP